MKLKQELHEIIARALFGYKNQNLMSLEQAAEITCDSISKRIESTMLEVIGEDEDAKPKYSKGFEWESIIAKNQLRAEMRKKVKEIIK